MQPNPNHPNPYLNPNRPKFQFTKSTKILPKKYPPQQSTQLINTKKIYQSMIKDQIYRLERLEGLGCVDPEIQEFQVKVEVQGEKEKEKGNKKEGMLGRRDGGIGREERNRKEENIDRYLDEEVGKKEINILTKSITKFKYKQFLTNLSSNRKSSKQLKASKYHNYQTVTKKYFNLLKSLSPSFSPSPSSPSPLSHLSQALTTHLLKNTLKIFKNSIENLQLKDRLNVYMKTREFRMKKLAIRFMRDWRVFLGKRGEVGTMVRRWGLRGIVEVRVEGRRIGELAAEVGMMRKRRNLLRFIQMATYSLSIQNLTNSLNQPLAIPPNLPKSLQQTLSTLSTTNSLKTSLLSHLKKTNLKQFLHLLNIQKKLAILRKMGIEKKSAISRIRGVLVDMRDWVGVDREGRRWRKERGREVWGRFLRGFLRNFWENARADIKLKKSIISCLPGTKQWLIKNKQIFKSEPLQSSISPSLSVNPPLLTKFSHPLQPQSLLQILPKQSKYKKIPTFLLKKTFLSNLHNLHIHNKKMKIIRYATEKLHQQYLMRIVWGVLKDLEGVRRIWGEEEDEERREEEEREEKEEREGGDGWVEKIGRDLGMMRMREFIRNLAKNHEVQREIKALNRIRSIKMKKQFITNLTKSSKKTKQITKNLKQSQSQFSTQKILKLLKLLSQNNHHQKNNKNQPQSPYKSLLQSHNSTNITQFLHLLHSNHKITKYSISITSLYLRNKIKKIREFYGRKKQMESIGRKGREIMGDRRRKFMRGFYLGLGRFWEGERMFWGKVQEIGRKRLGRIQGRFLKNLIKFSIGFRNSCVKEENSELIRNYLELNSSKIFLKRLRQNRVRKQQKNRTIQVLESKPEPFGVLVNQQQKKENKIEHPGIQPKKIEDEKALLQNKQQLHQLLTSSNQLHQPQPQPKPKFEPQPQPQPQPQQHLQNPIVPSPSPFPSPSPSPTHNHQKPISPIPPSSHLSASNIVQNNSEFQVEVQDDVEGEGEGEGKDGPEGIFDDQLDQKLFGEEEDEEGSISYEEYRRSMNKWEEEDQGSRTPDQSEFNTTKKPNKPQKNQLPQSSQANISPFPSPSSPSSHTNTLTNTNTKNNDNSNSNSRLAKYFPQHQHQDEPDPYGSGEKQELKKSEQNQEDELSDEDRAEEKSGFEKEQGSDREGNQSRNVSDSQISYNSEYFQNRYHTNLLKTHLKHWKNSINPNPNPKSSPTQPTNPIKPSLSPQLEPLQPSQHNLLQKLFTGWQMYSRQKSLVRKYLEQYEQDFHYYPESKEEYQEFRAIAVEGRI